ncbi:lipase family protein [Streptomyces specialis]|uniref:lipase family protein n=1 Tax=Streptomyces specialis TaxID=498367 RepID=UPI00073F3C86|nr:lipase family protein [Streptomyces specialis]
MSLRRAAVAASLALAPASFGCVTGLPPAAGAAAAAPTAATTATTTAPGTVRGIQMLPSSQRPAGAGFAARVTYTSTGVGGESTVVGGLVYVPSGQAPAGGWPVLSWAHGTTGLGDSCAPSANPVPAGMSSYLSTWLQAGYAVVATDYAGLGGPGVHPYLDGEIEARGVVDIVRAARKLSPKLFGTRWAVAGHSQGGHAALFTGHIAPDYAPELDFRGTVALAPPSNLTPMISSLNPDITVAPQLVPLLAYIFAGLQAANPEFDMGSYLSPLGAEVVTDAETLCNAALWQRTQGIDIGELLSRPLDDAFAEVMSATFDVPTSGYDDPLFIAQGVDDQTVAKFTTDQLVDDLTAAAQPVTYTTYPSVGHSDVLTASAQDALTFLAPLMTP